MERLIPEDVLRLQSAMIISETELKAIGSAKALRMEAERLAEGAVRKLLEDCVKTETSSHGNEGIFQLRLDVYVLSPDELRGIIEKAYKRGEEDGIRWHGQRSV